MSVLKPTRKNLKFTNITGSSSKNWVKANVSMFSWPKKKSGNGQENIWPMDR